MGRRFTMKKGEMPEISTCVMWTTSVVYAHSEISGEPPVWPWLVRCTSLLSGSLLESQRFACTKEADRLLQAFGLRLLPLGGLYPADIPSPM